MVLRPTIDSGPDVPTCVPVSRVSSTYDLKVGKLTGNFVKPEETPVRTKSSWTVNNRRFPSNSMVSTPLYSNEHLLPKVEIPKQKLSTLLWDFYEEDFILWRRKWVYLFCGSLESEGLSLRYFFQVFGLKVSLFGSEIDSGPTTTCYNYSVTVSVSSFIQVHISKRNFRATLVRENPL